MPSKRPARCALAKSYFRGNRSRVYVEGNIARAAELQQQFSLFPGRWMEFCLAAVMKTTANYLELPAGAPYPSYAPVPGDGLDALHRLLAATALFGKRVSMLEIERLSWDEAKILVDGAVASSLSINVPTCIAVADESGSFIDFVRMDKISSISIAIDKALTAVAARRGTHIYDQPCVSGSHLSEST